MLFGTCPRCGEFDRKTEHTCPPQWDVWMADESRHDKEEVFRLVFAKDEKTAAQKYAVLLDWEYYDNEFARSEYSDLVVVVPHGLEEPRTYLVILGRLEPSYEARERRANEFTELFPEPEQA